MDVTRLVIVMTAPSSLRRKSLMDLRKIEWGNNNEARAWCVWWVYSRVNEIFGMSINPPHIYTRERALFSKIFGLSKFVRSISWNASVNFSWENSSMLPLSKIEHVSWTFLIITDILRSRITSVWKSMMMELFSSTRRTHSRSRHIKLLSVLSIHHIACKQTFHRRTGDAKIFWITFYLFVLLLDENSLSVFFNLFATEFIDFSTSALRKFLHKEILRDFFSSANYFNMAKASFSIFHHFFANGTIKRCRKIFSIRGKFKWNSEIWTWKRKL